MSSALPGFLPSMALISRALGVWMKMGWVRLLWNDGQPAQNRAFRLM
jgi:hypothetical protein